MLWCVDSCLPLVFVSADTYFGVGCRSCFANHAFPKLNAPAQATHSGVRVGFTDTDGKGSQPRGGGAGRTGGRAPRVVRSFRLEEGSEVPPNLRLMVVQAVPLAPGTFSGGERAQVAAGVSGMIRTGGYDQYGGQRDVEVFLVTGKGGGSAEFTSWMESCSAGEVTVRLVTEAVNGCLDRWFIGSNQSGRSLVALSGHSEVVAHAAAGAILYGLVGCCSQVAEVRAHPPIALTMP